MSLPGRIRSLLWFVVAAYAVYLLLPMQGVENAAPTLDGSWQIALQVAVDQGLVFGRDFHSTYGPLGFLAARVLGDSTKWIILAYDIFVSLQLLLVCWCVYARTKHLVALALLFGVFYVLAGAGYFLDAPVVLFLLSTFWLYDQNDRPSWVKFCLAVVNAILAFYIKANLGLAAVGQVLGISLLQGVPKGARMSALAHILVTIGALLGSTLIVKVDLLSFVVSSSHFANGYNDSMYIGLSDKEYLNWAIGALVLVGLSVLATAIGGRAPLLGLSCAAFVFLLFKQAFVRSDGHIYVFFEYVAVPCAFLALFTSGRVRAWNSVALAYVLLMACWQGGIQYPFNPVERGALKWGQLQHYVTSFTRHPETPSGVPPISEAIKQIVQQSPIDEIPHTAAIPYYAGLHYVPRPVIQSYQAFDGFLDGLNAEYVAERGPPFFMVRLGCIDDRHCFFDDTQLKLSMLQYYDVVAEDGPYVLVQRRATPLQREKKLVRTGRLKLGEPLVITPSSGLQVVEFDVGYSTRGKMRRLFYKPRPLRVAIESDKGSKSYRGIVPILNAGVISSVDMREPQNIKTFYERRFSELPQMRSIKISSKHPQHFKGEFEYRVYEVAYR